MLYLVCFHPSVPDNIPLLDAIDNEGHNLMLYDGCYLLECSTTAVGIADHLRPYLPALGKLVVTKLYRGQCAGQLPDKVKDFMRPNISTDPEYRKPTGFTYQF